MSILARRAALFLALAALVLAAGAAAVDFTGYGRWAAARAGEPAEQAVRRLAGPTRSWLPGVLAAVPPDGTILYLADRMSDADWLAAYYLHPRALHVVSSAGLAAGARDGSLPDAGWLLAGGRLATWPTRQPVPRAEMAPGFPPPAPDLRGLLALALTGLAALGLGAALLDRLVPEPARMPGPGGRAGMALLAGLGALGFAHFAAAFLGQAGTVWLTAALTALGTAALAPGRRWLRAPAAATTSGSQPPDPLPLPRSLRRVLAALVLALLAATAARALGEPMQHWDERFQWAAKAKILLHEGGVMGPGFQDPHRPHLHRRYPLLVPGLEAHVARLAGGFQQERAVKGLFPLFFAGLLLTAHGALRQRLGPGAALSLTALLAALPPLHQAPAICGGPAHTGFADLPLAAFGLALAALAVPAGGGSRVPWPAVMLFAGLALLTKPEGIAFAAGAILLLLMTTAKDRPRLPAATLGRALLLLALVALPSLALNAAVPTEGTVGYTGDENYLGRLTPERLGHGLERNLPAAAAALATAPFTPRWAFLGALPLAGLILGWRQRHGGGHRLALLLLLPLAADLLAFTLTGSEIRWHLAVALDRLWLQVAPLLVLVAGGQMGRLAAPPA